MNAKAGTLLPELPAIDDIILPDKVDPDKVGKKQTNPKNKQW